MKFNYHFSWQVHLVKFGMVAGAPNLVFFNTKCARWARKQPQLAADCGLTGLRSDHARIIVGAANDASAVFSKFLSDFGISFFVPGTVFGDVGRSRLFAPRNVNDFSYVTRINHERLFPGRCSIWWYSPVAPRIVNDVSYLISGKDQSWEWFFVAGAVFGDGGGCRAR